MTSETESPLVQPLTATVGFTRKTAVNSQYNNNEVSLYLPVELPRVDEFDGDLEAYYKQVDDNLRTGFTTIKAHIFNQLGLEYEDKGGILIEKVAAAFPGSTPAPAQSAPAPRAASTAPAGAAHPVFGSCKGCGGNQFWDNRATKKGRQPDGKCKDTACAKGVWL